MERDIEPLELNERAISLNVKPFEIVTVKLRL
jgi:hypothetical protein